MNRSIPLERRVVLEGEKSEEVEGWLRGEGLSCPEGQFRTCTAGVLCTPQLQRNGSCLLTAFTGRRREAESGGPITRRKTAYAERIINGALVL